MTRIAYLVTSAREIALADETQHPTGYFAEEALTPYERFTGAGFDVTVLTPDGRPPYADPYGLSWFFHYPDQDKDYLASVVRTFAHDVDDIRVTLHQNTELGLAAARRVAALLQASGHTAAEAHRIVSGAAKTAWRQDRQFATVLAENPVLADGSSHGLSPGRSHPPNASRRSTSAAVNPQISIPRTRNAGKMKPRGPCTISRAAGSASSVRLTRSTAATSPVSTGATAHGCRHHASTGMTRNPVGGMNASGRVPITSTPAGSTPTSSAASRSAVPTGPSSPASMAPPGKAGWPACRRSPGPR